MMIRVVYAASVIAMCSISAKAEELTLDYIKNKASACTNNIYKMHPDATLNGKEYRSGTTIIVGGVVFTVSQEMKVLHVPHVDLISNGVPSDELWRTCMAQP